MKKRYILLFTALIGSGIYFVYGIEKQEISPFDLLPDETVVEIINTTILSAPTLGEANKQIARLKSVDSRFKRITQEREPILLQQFKISAKKQKFIDAVKHKNILLIQEMIKQGIDLNKGYNEGFTPLHEAAIQGDVRILPILLNAGAKPQAQDKDGITPLHVAAVYGRTGAAQQLLEEGADINSKVSSTGDTPLHIAAAAKDDVYTSFLNTETAKIQQDMVTFLLKHGADPSITDNYGDTAADQEGTSEEIAALIRSYTPST